MYDERLNDKMNDTKPDVAASAVERLVMPPLFEKYNSRLCHAISALAIYYTTQKPLSDNDYLQIKNLLSELRIDLHDNTAA